MNVRFAHPVRKFNPGTLQSDDEVEQQFVVRQKELGIVADVLRGNIGSPSCQHVMIIAPRGRGKTMLLVRLSAELRTASEFAGRLLPVRFMEESLEITDEAEFWLEAIFQLAQEIAGSEPDVATELKTSRTDLLSKGGTELAERALATVLDAADQLGQRLVLMVENMQDLCRDADRDFGWALRRVLQTEPRIMLVSTATTRLQDLDKANGPFFELFRDLALMPLDTEECRRLWIAISGDAVTRRAIRPLEILTGGNPRLLVIVAQFSRHRSLKQLMEELVTLIDDHTEYFRGHLESMVKGERRVYIALIDLWQPSSTGEIAARARMGVRKASVMLGRLLGKELVVFKGTGNRRLYSAAEPLYAIYYKLRRERDEAAVVVNLIRFMVAFYTDPELETISDMLVREARESPPIRAGLVRALDDAELAGFLSDALPADDDLGLASASGTNHEADVKADRSLPEPVAGENELQALIHKAQEYRRLGHREAELGVYEEIEARFGASAESVAWAMLCKALTLGQLDRPLDELAAYEAVEEQFGDERLDQVRTVVAKAGFYKAITLGQLGRPQDSVTACEAVEKSFSGDGADEVRAVVAKAGFYRALTLGQLGRLQDSVAACEAVDEEFSGDGAAEVRAVVANACFCRALTLGQLERPQDALAAYEAVEERFGDDELDAVRTVAAKACFYRALTLGRLDRPRDKLAAYEAVEERFGDDELDAVQAVVAKACFFRALALGQLDRPKDAVAACDAVEERFSGDGADDVRAVVAKACFYRALTLAQLDEPRSELVAYEAVEERFGDDELDEVRVIVAKACFYRALTLAQLDRPLDELAAYEAVEERFGDDELDEVRAVVAKVCFHRALALGRLDRPRDAVTAFEAVDERFGKDVAVETQEVVARALVHKGLLLVSENRLDMAIASFLEVGVRYRRNGEPEMQRHVANALASAGLIHKDQGNVEQALREWERVVGRYGASEDRDTRDMVANALVWQATTHLERKSFGAAEQLCDEIEHRFGSEDTEDQRKSVAKASVVKGRIAVDTGREVEGVRIADEIERRFGTQAHDDGIPFAWRARQLKATALARQRRNDEAMDELRSAYGLFVPKRETIREMVGLVVEMVKSGVPATDLFDLIAQNHEAAASLEPLSVALAQECGVEMRAPEATLEIAADIRSMWSSTDEVRS